MADIDSLQTSQILTPDFIQSPAFFPQPLEKKLNAGSNPAWCSGKDQLPLTYLSGRSNLVLDLIDQRFNLVLLIDFRFNW